MKNKTDSKTNNKTDDRINNPKKRVVKTEKRNTDRVVSIIGICKVCILRNECKLVDECTSYMLKRYPFIVDMTLKIYSCIDFKTEE